MGLDFYIFLATCKKSKKCNICISHEAVHNQTTRPRDDRIDMKQMVNRINTLEAGSINPVEMTISKEGVLMQTSVLLPSVIIFG